MMCCRWPRPPSRHPSSRPDATDLRTFPSRSLTKLVNQHSLTGSQLGWPVVCPASPHTRREVTGTSQHSAWISSSQLPAGMVLLANSARISGECAAVRDIAKIGSRARCPWSHCRVAWLHSGCTRCGQIPCRRQDQNGVAVISRLSVATVAGFGWSDGTVCATARASP